MELKLVACLVAAGVRWLLIVPYGIETFLPVCIRKTRYLLIVPYGIETD